MPSGTTELGSSLADATPRAAPGVPLAYQPLCRRPSIGDNNHCGALTRWSHVNLRSGLPLRIFRPCRAACQGHHSLPNRPRAWLISCETWPFAYLPNFVENAAIDLLQITWASSAVYEQWFGRSFVVMDAQFCGETFKSLLLQTRTARFRTALKSGIERPGPVCAG
jgi:hypothetical protein